MSDELPIKVTISDPETGAVLDEATVSDDYLVITAGDHRLAHTRRYSTGTVVLTIKKGDSPS